MAALLPHAALAQHRLEIPPGGPLRILHISDTHHHPLQSGCRDAIAPCTPKNTTDFLAAAVAAEKPSLIVFTGDISDEFIGSDWTGREWVHRRTTQPEVALASIYDTGKTNNIPFVASLGNHDGALPHYSRAQVMRYIAADPRSLVTENEIDGSVGNYYLDLVHRGSRAPVARLWFLDARLEPGLPNILDAQLEWLEATAAELPPAPSLAFFHIPLPEYSTAPRVSGTLRESVSADQPNRATFSRLRTALGRGLIATFCGHDHTNDFCAALDGVRLCYTGSAGFTAYGRPTVRRRVRVTELTTCDGLCQVRTWKRLAGLDGGIDGTPIDVETIWTVPSPPPPNPPPYPPELAPRPPPPPPPPSNVALALAAAALTLAAVAVALWVCRRCRADGAHRRRRRLSDEAKSRWVSMESMPTAADEGPAAADEVQHEVDVT